MSTTLQPLRSLTREMRVHGPALLSGIPEPHDELMSLVWGPRFDREHALGLIARQPALAGPALPGLLAAADAFDALHIAAKQRLRELIRRHRALSAAPSVRGDRVVAAVPLQAMHGNLTRDWSMGDEVGSRWGIAPGASRAALTASSRLPV